MVPKPKVVNALILSISAFRHRFRKEKTNIPNARRRPNMDVMVLIQALCSDQLPFKKSNLVRSVSKAVCLELCHTADIKWMARNDFGKDFICQAFKFVFASVLISECRWKISVRLPLSW
jgi:hypothetical protein